MGSMGGEGPERAEDLWEERGEARGTVGFRGWMYALPGITSQQYVSGKVIPGEIAGG